MSLILHHYDFSNFAEKARLMLGFKGLAWLGVEQPSILPKPDLTLLTGGYRRIPVLQEGADLWCDTRLIARELERGVPESTLFPAATSGAAEATAWWAEHQFMRPVALFVSGINADHMPAGLHEDRARLHGLPPPSIEAVRKAAVRNLHLVRPQIQWLADMLQDGRTYLLGDQPCIADFAAYHVVWFFKGRHIDCRHELLPYPRLLAWRDPWRRSATASASTSIPPSRSPWPAPPSPRRRCASRIRRRAIPCRESKHACGPRTMPGTGSKARWVSSIPTRSRWCATTPTSAGSPCTSRGWVMTGGAPSV